MSIEIIAQTLVAEPFDSDLFEEQLNELARNARQEFNAIINAAIPHNEEGDTLLHLACRKGCQASMKILLSVDVSTQAINRQGQHPHHCIPAEHVNRAYMNAYFSVYQSYRDLAHDLGFSLNKTLHLLKKCFQLQRGVAQIPSAVLVVGKTRVGKSSLINYMHGSTYRRVRIAGRRAIMQHDGGQAEMARVGHRLISETFCSAVYDFEQQGLSWVDTQGFDDNRLLADAARINPYNVISAVNLKFLRRRVDNIKAINLVVSAKHVLENNIEDIYKIFKNASRFLHDEHLGHVDRFVLSLTQVDGCEEFESITQAEKIAAIRENLRNILDNARERYSGDKQWLKIERLFSHFFAEGSKIALCDVSSPNTRQELNDILGGIPLTPCSELNFGDNNEYFEHFEALNERLADLSRRKREERDEKQRSLDRNREGLELIEQRLVNQMQEKNQALRVQFLANPNLEQKIQNMNQLHACLAENANLPEILRRVDELAEEKTQLEREMAELNLQYAVHQEVYGPIHAIYQRIEGVAPERINHPGLFGFFGANLGADRRAVANQVLEANYANGR